MKLQPNEKINIEEILKDLENYSPKRKGWTWRKKLPDDCPDGPRYKAIGNSMAVPVIEWIGLRIQRACCDK